MASRRFGGITCVGDIKLSLIYDDILNQTVSCFFMICTPKPGHLLWGADYILLLSISFENYQTRENYHYDQSGYISRQYIQSGDYRYHNDHHGQIKIDNLDLYQQGNKLNRIGNNYYSYDKARRLVKKTAIKDGFRGKTLYYRWNGNNQLESLTNEWGEVWYYKYDALGRRIEKACPQRHTKTTYLWDGDQVAYHETEKHGKTEGLRHCIFNG